MLARRKLETSTTEEEFESARAAFSAACEKAQLLQKRFDALESANAAANAAPWELREGRLDVAYKRIAESFPEGPPAKAKLPAMIAAAREAIDEASPDVAPARENMTSPRAPGPMSWPASFNRASAPPSRRWCEGSSSCRSE